MRKIGSPICIQRVGAPMFDGTVVHVEQISKDKAVIVAQAEDGQYRVITTSPRPLAA